MTIQEQICSLELARKLKKLGVRQSSIFAWEKMCGKTNWNLMYGSLDDIHPVNWDSYAKTYEAEAVVVSAFTVAELGEMLPKHIHNSKKDTPGTIDGQGNLVVRWVVEGCLVGYDCLSERLKKLEERLVPTMIDISEADCRAKMLIYLLENGLIKI